MRLKQQVGGGGPGARKGAQSCHPCPRSPRRWSWGDRAQLTDTKTDRQGEGQRGGPLAGGLEKGPRERAGDTQTDIQTDGAGEMDAGVEPEDDSWNQGD